MKRLVLPGAVLLSWGVILNVAAQDLSIAIHPFAPISLQEYLQQRPSLQAESLKPESLKPVNHRNLSQNPIPGEPISPEEEIVVEGQRQPQTSAPVYDITGEEIDKQGANSVTEALRNLPGFAINDAGFGRGLSLATVKITLL